MGFFVSASGSQVAGLSLESLLEQPYVKYSEVGAGVSNNVPYTGAVTATIDIGTWEGVHGDLLNTSDYSSLDGGNPPLGPKLEVFLYAFGSGGSAIPLKVELEFEAVFTIPKLTVPSLLRPPTKTPTPAPERKEEDGVKGWFG
jgi:hypothetical protein